MRSKAPVVIPAAQRAYQGTGNMRGMSYNKGGRVTGIAKRGFGRALMKGQKLMRQNGVRSDVRFPYGSGMKKGGKAKRGKGSTDRKDESIAMTN